MNRREAGQLILGASVGAALAAQARFRGGAAAASGATFDYYISTTGSNSNPGTLASPWAITAINTKQSTYAGKRVGIIAGTYDISSLMNGTYHTPVLNVNGGPNSSTLTYIGSSDASGNESPRVTTLDAKGSSGFYGGGNSNISSMIGQGYEVNSPANKGNFTIAGLKLIGFSLWAIHIGNYDGATAQPANVTIRDCELTGGSGQNCTSAIANGTNLGPIINYTSLNSTITNNYLHDNFGWTDANHFSGMYLWGLGSGTVGLTVTNNTLVNSGNIHQKEHVCYNSIVAYNYVDMTNKTPGGGSAQNAAAIFGFNPDAGSGTGTSIHHNICIHNGSSIVLQNDTGQNGWLTPVAVYNNTSVMVSAQTSGNVIYSAYANTTPLSPQPVSFYNNLEYDNGFALNSSYGYWLTNLNAFLLSDYNIYGTGVYYVTVPAGQTNSTGASNHSTLASFGSAIGGFETHSTTNTTNPFTNNGTYAKQYQVQSGSPAYQTGRIGGTSGGAVCNVGAWDGTVTQIGCNFAV